MIIIAPFAQKLRTGMPNPKSPSAEWWLALLGLLRRPVVQIGVSGEPALTPDFREGMRLQGIAQLVRECETWISCDSFLPHLAHHERVPGVVVWSQSDPRIFGYEENSNVIKSLAYLRKDPFGIWEAESHRPDAFPEVEDVAGEVEALCALRRAA